LEATALNVIPARVDGSQLQEVLIELAPVRFEPELRIAVKTPLVHGVGDLGAGEEPLLRLGLGRLRTEV
jgi:hypothetical protein